jgi:Actin like proteins N terminal domain
MKTSVFAVDVGYGNTKYAYRAASGTVATGMFPSLAPLAASRTLSGYGEGVLAARKVITITIDEIEYEVGPDVALTAAYGNTGRALADDFVLTDNYAALLAGAMHFAGVTHIERLVLGLPVHNMQKYSVALKERFAGELDFGHARVQVDKVVVMRSASEETVPSASDRHVTVRPGEHDLVRDLLDDDGLAAPIEVGRHHVAMVHNRGDGKRSIRRQADPNELAVIENRFRLEGRRAADRVIKIEAFGRDGNRAVVAIAIGFGWSIRLPCRAAFMCADFGH